MQTATLVVARQVANRLELAWLPQRWPSASNSSRTDVRMNALAATEGYAIQSKLNLSGYKPAILWLRLAGTSLGLDGVAAANIGITFCESPL